MLAPFRPAPLPTFESFVVEKAEGTPPNLKAIKAALYEVNLEMKASRLHADSLHPDNAVQAAQHLYDWACRVTAQKLGRELNEVEQTYLQEQCSTSTD